MFSECIFSLYKGGNGKNIEKSIETWRLQANVKSVEAALNLQSQQGFEQSESTNESTTLTSTEDDANEDAEKQSNNHSGGATQVRCIQNFRKKTIL